MLAVVRFQAAGSETGEETGLSICNCTTYCEFILKWPLFSTVFYCIEKAAISIEILHLTTT